jgi:hypothetical protein
MKLTEATAVFREYVTDRIRAGTAADSPALLVRVPQYCRFIAASLTDAEQRLRTIAAKRHISVDLPGYETEGAPHMRKLSGWVDRLEYLGGWGDLNTALGQMSKATDDLWTAARHLSQPGTPLPSAPQDGWAETYERSKGANIFEFLPRWADALDAMDDSITDLETEKTSNDSSGGDRRAAAPSAGTRGARKAVAAA